MTVQKVFENLKEEDFVQGLEYDKTEEGIMYFTATDMESLVEFIINGITDTKYHKDGYLYTDGTKTRFVKSHNWWEFKQYGKVICRISIGG